MFEVAGGGYLTPSTRHAIEIIHLSIFVVAVVYAVFVGALVSMSLWISRRWRHMEAMDPDSVVDAKGPFRVPAGCCCRDHFVVVWQTLRLLQLQLLAAADAI